MINRPRVLLDENLPIRLRSWLPELDVVTVDFMGWKGVRNGELVGLAQAAHFAVLVTADRSFALTPRAWAPLGCVHVTSNNPKRLEAAAKAIEDACRMLVPGQVVTVRV